jgi:predicted transcriptional regulator
MGILPSRKLKRGELLKKDISIRITRDVRSSGLLAFLSPEDLQTLITLLTFVDESGRCELRARTLARALNLSEDQAQRRLRKLCSVRWQGKPLVMRENGRKKGRFLAHRYQVMEIEGLELAPDGEPEVSRPAAPSADDEGEAPNDTRIAANSANGCDSRVVMNNINNKHTKEKQREAKEGEKKRIFNMLLDCGVSRPIASRLLVKFPEDRVARQIEMLPFRNPREPAAMLINAIVDDWSAPAAYMARQREEAKRKARAEEEARRAERERVWHKRIEEAKTRMSPAEIEGVTRRAREKVERTLGGVFRGEAPQSLVRAEVNRIIAERYLSHGKN